MAAPELVHYQVADGVATVTLDSPSNRNALSSALLGQLVHALDRAGADADARVVVLTGADPAFCSGADLTEQQAGSLQRASFRNQAGQTAGRFPLPEVLRRLWRSPKPVICRVNGAARAGGIGLIGACDIAVAREHASFAFSEVRVGVVPAIIAVTCLPRLAPRAATEYLLTGEVFDARRAVEIGLLSRAVPDDALDAEVARYAELLRRGGPEALGRTKEVLRELPGLDFDVALDRMQELSRERFASAEALEGMRAFAEKRAPSWAAPGGSGGGAVAPGPAGRPSP
jgi:methylglutaconyl-CoA hydratase